jgi:hypothetical protein
MTNHDFAHLMRRMWGWLAAAGSITTAVMALLLTVGVLDTSPLTGTGMGLLAVFAVASIGCWTYWRGEVKS